MEKKLTWGSLFTFIVKSLRHLRAPLPLETPPGAVPLRQHCLQGKTTRRWWFSVGWTGNHSLYRIQTDACSVLWGTNNWLMTVSVKQKLLQHLYHLSCSTSSLTQFIHLYVCACTWWQCVFACVFCHVCNDSVSLFQDDYIPYPRIEEVTSHLFLLNTDLINIIMLVHTLPLQCMLCNSSGVCACCRCWRGGGLTLR